MVKLYLYIPHIENKMHVGAGPRKIVPWRFIVLVAFFFTSMNLIRLTDSNRLHSVNIPVDALDNEGDERAVAGFVTVHYYKGFPSRAAFLNAPITRILPRILNHNTTYIESPSHAYGTVAILAQHLAKKVVVFEPNEGTRDIVTYQATELNNWNNLTSNSFDVKGHHFGLTDLRALSLTESIVLNLHLSRDDTSLPVTLLPALAHWRRKPTLILTYLEDTMDVAPFVTVGQMYKRVFVLRDRRMTMQDSQLMKEVATVRSLDHGIAYLLTDDEGI